MAMPDNPVESQEVETAEGRRAVVRTTRTLLYLQERAERNQGRRYRLKKKNIQAAKFRKEQKEQWKQNRKEEKELKKRRKEFEQDKNSQEKNSREKNSRKKNSMEKNFPEKDSKEKKSTEPHAGSGNSREGTSGPNQQKPDTRQKQDAKRQEAYEEYIRKKKEKKKQQKQEETSGQKKAGTVTAGASGREAEELLRKKKEELEKKESELKKQEEAFKKREKEEKKDRKQGRKNRRRSRASRTVKGRMKGIWKEDMAVFKSGLKHMPARGTLMLMDDLNAEQMAGRMGAFGIRWVLRLFRQISLLFLAAAKSVLLLLSPLLLLSVFLVFMLYIIFFSPLSYLFDTGSSGSGNREEMPYRTMWEDVDYTEVEAAIKTALIERQQELSRELQAAGTDVRLISFAPTTEELADFTTIMKAMMIAGGIYPADIHTWIAAKTGKKKCAELAELVCHVLTDEEVELLLHPEGGTEAATGEESTAGPEPTQPQESGINPQYVDKYLGFYRLSELKKNGKLKDYELFLD